MKLEPLLVTGRGEPQERKTSRNFYRPNPLTLSTGNSKVSHKSLSLAYRMMSMQHTRQALDNSILEGRPAYLNSKWDLSSIEFLEPLIKVTTPKPRPRQHPAQTPLVVAFPPKPVMEMPVQNTSPVTPRIVVPTLSQNGGGFSKQFSRYMEEAQNRKRRIDGSAPLGPRKSVPSRTPPPAATESLEISRSSSRKLDLFECDDELEETAVRQELQEQALLKEFQRLNLENVRRQQNGSKGKALRKFEAFFSDIEISPWELQS